MSPHDQTLLPALDKCPKSLLHHCQCLSHSRLPHTHPHLHTSHLPYTGPGTQALPGIQKRGGRYGWGCHNRHVSWIRKRSGHVKESQFKFSSEIYLLGPPPKSDLSIFRDIGIPLSSILCMSRNIYKPLTMYYVPSVLRRNSRRNLEGHHHHPQSHHSRCSHCSHHHPHPLPCQKTSTMWKMVKESHQ